MQIVLDSRGLQLSVRNRCFEISDETETRIIHPQRISSILVTAPCRISSPAIVLAAQSQIQLVICNNYGRPEARLWTPRFLNTSALRRKQYRFCEGMESVEWAKRILQFKTEGQKDNLRFMAARKTSLKNEVEGALEKLNRFNIADIETVNTELTETKKKLLFTESFTASQYWQLIGLKLPAPFTFSCRVKQKPTDAFNASINYLYGILRQHVEGAILSFGIDPALGVMHRDGYKLPSLVFDLMEPFRPVADRMLIKAILHEQLPADMLSGENENVRISTEGRRKLIRLFTDTLYSRVILGGQAGMLNNLILGEVKHLTDRIKKIKYP